MNHWTTKHGALIAPDAKRRPGRRRPAGDRRATALPTSRSSATRRRARASSDRRARAPRPSRRPGFRTADAGAARSPTNRWRDDPYEDASTDEWIDPRTLSIALNELLPADKAVAVDSGHFLGYPSMFLDVPDARSWVFANGFQAVGLGLGNAIGAADRAAGPADGRGDRRRRRVHGAGRARDRGAAEAEAAGRDLRRRRLRRRGPPLRADGARRRARAVPRRRPRRDRRARPARRRRPCATPTTSESSRRGSPSPTRGRSCSTPRSTRRSARNGWRRRSAPAEPTRRQRMESSRMSTHRSGQVSEVSALLGGLADGSVEIVDLTQPLTETTPVIQLPPPFANTPGLTPRGDQPLRRPRPRLGLVHADDRRARRHAPRRADPLGHRQGRRRRRLDRAADSWSARRA